jgi:hypothetical protein
MKIEAVRDGNAICALIGSDPQSGIVGCGETLPEALRDLAGAIERERYPLPELAPTAEARTGEVAIYSGRSPHDDAAAREPGRLEAARAGMGNPRGIGDPFSNRCRRAERECGPPSGELYRAWLRQTCSTPAPHWSPSENELCRSQQARTR